MTHHRTFMAGILVVPLAVALVASTFAGSVTIPNTFVAGTTASAAEVNANFDALRVAVNDNDSRIGALEAASPTRYLSVAAMSFKPAALPNTGSFVSFSGQGGAYFTSGITKLIAAVNLPHGATVTRFTAFFDDTSSNDLIVKLQFEVFDSTFGSLATVVSESNTGLHSRTTDAISEKTIDNTKRGYAVSVVAPQGWDADLKIKGALIYYTMP